MISIFFALVCSLGSQQDGHVDRAAEDAAAERQRRAREFWQQLEPEERARWEENLARWRALDEGQRDAMRRRHRTLESWRERVDRSLEGEERRRVDRLAGPERRRALEERTRDVLHRFGRTLPDDVRQRMRREAAHADEPMRAERLRAMVRETLEQRFEQAVTRLQEQGTLGEQRAAELRRRYRGSDADEQRQLLQRFFEAHPVELDIPADVLRALLRTEADGPRGPGSRAPHDARAPDRREGRGERARRPGIDAVRAAERLRAPRLSRDAVLNYLRAHAVEESELEPLRRMRPPQFEQAVERLMERHHVPALGRMSRALRARGADDAQLRDAISGDSPDEVRRRLDALMSKHGLRASDRARPGDRPRPDRRSDGRR